MYNKGDGYITSSLLILGVMGYRLYINYGLHGVTVTLYLYWCA